jgi:hypothetical protein
MRYTVKKLVDLFSAMDPNEIIHLWYRHREDFESEEGEITVIESIWSTLADYEGKIEDQIDEIMRDLIEDDTQRFDYDA